MLNRCAICVRGPLRNWELAFSSIASNFLDKYSCDVFVHSWDSVMWYSGKSYLPEENGFVKLKDDDKGFLDNGEIVDFNKLYEWYKPKVMHFENFLSQQQRFNEKAKYFTRAYTRPLNTISQFWGIKKSLEMMFDYATENQIHYDYIISIRPDLLLQQDLPPLEKNVFYTLNSRNKKNQGTGDSVMVGNYQDMLALSTVYDNLEGLYDILQISCPHLYVEYFARQMNVWKEFTANAKVCHSRSGQPYEESD